MIDKQICQQCWERNQPTNILQPNSIVEYDFWLCAYNWQYSTRNRMWQELRKHNDIPEYCWYYLEQLLQQS